MYDKNNIFAKILRSEVAATKIYEDEYMLAFYDIFAKTKVHALLIPKGTYSDLGDFLSRASNEEILGFFKSFPKVINILGLKDNGFRTISNCGNHGHQEVGHLHFHILGGEDTGPMICKSKS